LACSLPHPLYINNHDVLSHYSKPRLSLIDWHMDVSYNVVFNNDTRDLYRFFDATHQAEFLAECLEAAATEILPSENRSVLSN
jgi:hypothetical protein